MVVILCKRLSHAEEALGVVKWVMGKLELKFHNEKTRLVDMYFGKDSFLGFNNRFQRFRSKTGSGIGHYNRYRLRRL